MVGERAFLSDNRGMGFCRIIAVDAATITVQMERNGSKEVIDKSKATIEYDAGCNIWDIFWSGPQIAE